MLPFSPAGDDHSYYQCFLDTADDLPQGIGAGWQIQSGQYAWDGTTRPQCHYGLIQLTLAGQGVLERHGVQYLLEPGQAFFLTVPDDHRYFLPATSHAWEFLYIDFQGGDDILRLVRWLVEHHGPVIALPPAHPARQLLVELARAVYDKTIPSAEMGAQLLYGLFMTVRESLHPHRIHADSSIQRAQRYIAQHYMQEIAIADIAHVVGLSPSYFYRRYHALTGETPHAYLLRLRLAHGQRLLRDTCLTLDDISTRCGFTDGNYFGKVFKRLLGITPMQYKQACVDGADR
jgi:AraC-like DNA-binding protein